jgi:hypothetical protein
MDLLKKMVRRTKQKIRHPLKEHPHTNVIADKAEVLFPRNGARTEPDFENHVHSQFTDEPAPSETHVRAAPIFTQRPQPQRRQPRIYAALTYKTYP